MGVPKLRPSAASAQRAHRKTRLRCDDEIQLTTKPRSHHSALRARRTGAGPGQAGFQADPPPHRLAGQ
jgi:hypothetical protein